jgi:predicted amidohydrolase
MPPSLLKQMSNILSPASPFKLALIQLGNVGADKTKNLVHTREKILEAAKNGAKVVVLPVSLLYYFYRHVSYLI